METYTIGQLAELTGLTRVTIRYYERAGLLLEVDRKHSGYRIYTESSVPLLNFIKNAKLVGFSLEEIKEIIQLQHQSHSSSQTIKNKIALKLNEIQLKISSLQTMAETLTLLNASCDGQGVIDKCPILLQMQQAELEVNPQQSCKDAHSSKK